jgi:hypothetical protein
MQAKHILVFISSHLYAGQLLVERLQALLVLASFEHQVQLAFYPSAQHLLNVSSAAVQLPFANPAKILQSLQYYDMPAVWLLEYAEVAGIGVVKQLADIDVAAYDMVLTW